MTNITPAPVDVPDAPGTYPATYIIGTNKNLLGKPVTFRKPSGVDLVDEIDTGLKITRLNNSGLINAAAESSYSSNSSPAGTEWNSEGWDNLDQVANRSYTSFRSALQNQVGTNIINTGLSKLVMHDMINDKYYKVQFHFWQQGAQGGGGANNNSIDKFGGFSYTRQQIFITQEIEYFSEGASDPVCEVSEFVHLKRDAVGGIYNQLIETEWNPNSSPAGVLWNIEGWDNIENFETREYHPLFPTTGPLGNYITDRKFIMLDVAAKEYYKVEFFNWGEDNGGSWGMLRTKLNKAGNPSGIVFGDGSVQDTANGFIPQNYQGSYNDYTLQLSDIGKHVYKNDSDGYAVYIPADYQVNFPIGSAITVVSGNSWTYIRPSDSGFTELWGAGFNDTSNYFYIPNNSMATLLKIGANKWMLSGAGLGID
jgi:hypothetical protein